MKMGFRKSEESQLSKGQKKMSWRKVTQKLVEEIPKDNTLKEGQKKIS